MLLHLRILTISLLVFCSAYGQIENAGQNIYISSDTVKMSRTEDGSQILIFEEGFSLEYSSSTFQSEKAVVWVRKETELVRGMESHSYRLRCYLEDQIKVGREGKHNIGDVHNFLVERGKSMIADFFVSGKVFLECGQQQQVNAAEIELYRNAVGAARGRREGLKLKREALPPGPQREQTGVQTAQEDKGGSIIGRLLGKSRQSDKSPEAGGSRESAKPDEQKDYPVNVAALWKPAPVIERSRLSDGESVITVMGRFYIWRKMDDSGRILEFQADRAVLFLGQDEVKAGAEETGRRDLLASGDIKAAYIEGNIVFTEGLRTIRADRLYYNFQNSQALVVNSEMTRYDPERNIPIFIRAEKLQKKSDSVFTAEGVEISSDEFAVPQLSVNASSVVITDNSAVDTKPQAGSFSAELEDVSLQYYNNTLLKSDHMITGLERPELPVKSVGIGGSTAFGTSLETNWYLSRVLGFKEPEGLDTTLNLDYYSKRGPAGGIDAEYESDSYFGSIESYVIHDTGEDRLGDRFWRKDLEPENELRGRFKLQHREYLDDGWQFSAELNYLSDRNFLESFYRSERFTDKEPESVVYLKNSTGNRAFSVLGKVRLNDFQNQLEQLPTFEYHRTGESILGDNFTYYGDTKLSRARQRYDSDSAMAGSGFFSAASTRHEIDYPFIWGETKYVPYAAGTYAYNDYTGYNTELDGDQINDPENGAFLGEAGIRVSSQFWKTEQFVKSDFWDINGIRHYLRPHMEAAVFQSDEDGLEMRNMVNLGLSQRWQTRRGSQDNLRTEDLMRLDINATLLSDDRDEDDDILPGRYIFSSPYEPFYRRSGSADFSLQRDTIDADYLWNISDTFAFSSYANYDLESSELQRFDAGLARYCWPDLSWYFGVRHLKNIILTDIDKTPANNQDYYYEHGTNSFRTAMSYKLNSRYTITAAQEYDFDFGQSVRSEIVLIRRYRRLLYSLGYSVDESLDSSSVTVSIWPQGVKELAVGSRTYVGLTGSSSYE
ncbi:Organic solvent tolerance protein OstA [Sedimentisphaera salicampi]|nr:Organic solvent tolerance protein OstA [Sedimentisphaera salicampi]